MVNMRHQLEATVTSAVQASRPATTPTPVNGERAGLRRDLSLFSLDIERIRPDKDQVRRQNKSAADAEIREMAETMRENGIMQPLNVRYVADGDYYEIVAGERRYIAAKLAGLAEVPVRIVKADDAQVRRLQLIENVHRADLTVVELGTALQDLIAAGDSVATVAKTIHKSPAYVTMALTIVRKLSAQALSECQTLGLSHLYHIAQLPATEQVEAVRAARDGGLTRKQLQQSTLAARNAAAADGTRKRGRPPTSKPYVLTVAAPNGGTVSVRFRKMRATTSEVADALRHALTSVSKQKPKT